MFFTFGSGIPPTQLSKYGNLGHVNVSVVQEPLAFILPKREPVFCLDKELVPELPAPAPALPPKALSPEPVTPVTPAVPDAGQEEVESAGPPQPDEPSAGI